MRATRRFLDRHFLACAASGCSLVVFAMVLADLLVVPANDPNIGLGLVLLLVGLPGCSLGVAAVWQEVRPRRHSRESVSRGPLALAAIALVVCAVSVIDVRLVEDVQAAGLSLAGWTTHADCWRDYPDWQWGRYCERP